MDVNKAVETAREYVEKLYVKEQIMDVGLEEVEFDCETYEWKVTIGFSRPWDMGRTFGLAAALSNGLRRRSYKVIRVCDDGEVRSLRDHGLSDPTS